MGPGRKDKGGAVPGGALESTAGRVPGVVGGPVVTPNEKLTRGMGTAGQGLQGLRTQVWGDRCGVAKVHTACGPEWGKSRESL